jgi:hypothetical protein
MTTASRISEVTEVDRFLAEAKTVTEALPEWKDGNKSGLWQAEWPIADVDGVLLEGTRLVFTVRKDDPQTASIRLLLRGQQVFGIDLLKSGSGKPNPPDAHRMSLPREVRGSHFHRWDDNRARALVVGVGELPYRRPTPMALTKLNQALKALAQEVNLVLTPEQLSFDAPAQGYLSMGGDLDL